MSRILITADWHPGIEGGADQYMIGLVAGLNSIAKETEQYIINGPPENPCWLQPWAGNRFQFISRAVVPPSPFDKFKRALGPVRAPLGLLRRAIASKSANTTRGIPASDGFWEAHADIVHQPYPLRYVQTSLSTILTMCDLQHRHFPQFFSAEHLAWREMLYPIALRDSRAVIVISEWGKRDLIQKYGVPSEKIFVIHVAPTTSVYGPVTHELKQQTRTKYKLPERFLFYPALTYGHKNHVRLLEALAVLRDRHQMKINLVCTGHRTLQWQTVESRLKQLHLESQVRFLGFVPVQDLRAIYQLAHWLVFPTLFEGAGIPLVEAFREGLPVLCSDIPVFREYGEDAPIYFEPTSIDDIAETISRTFDSEDLRASCRQRGLSRGADFDWSSAAQLYQAVYRSVGQKVRSDSDAVHVVTTPSARAV